jgi:hypothetical protein
MGEAMTPPRVVGLDLSLATTGVAFEGGTWTIKTSPSDKRLEDRLHQIVSDLSQMAPADLYVIEDLPHAVAYGGTQLGMVHGVVRYHLRHHSVALVPPAVLKKYATEKGNATKADMRVAWLKRTGEDVADDNRCDAIWLYAMGLDRVGRPLFELPVAQRDALDKVQWQP